jgi:hypothetical protein
MNKWLMLVVLVLLVLVSAVGLRNLAANQTARPSVVSTSAPVPVMPPDNGQQLYASTSAPVPVMPPDNGQQ